MFAGGRKHARDPFEKASSGEGGRCTVTSPPRARMYGAGAGLGDRLQLSASGSNRPVPDGVHSQGHLVNNVVPCRAYQHFLAEERFRDRCILFRAHRFCNRSVDEDGFDVFKNMLQQIWVFRSYESYRDARSVSEEEARFVCSFDETCRNKSKMTARERWRLRRQSLSVLAA